MGNDFVSVANGRGRITGNVLNLHKAACREPSLTNAAEQTRTSSGVATKHFPFRLAETEIQETLSEFP
jgi:hypothetical protein